MSTSSTTEQTEDGKQYQADRTRTAAEYASNVPASLFLEKATTVKNLLKILLRVPVRSS